MRIKYLLSMAVGLLFGFASQFSFASTEQTIRFAGLGTSSEGFKAITTQSSTVGYLASDNLKYALNEIYPTDAKVDLQTFIFKANNEHVKNFDFINLGIYTFGTKKILFKKGTTKVVFKNANKSEIKSLSLAEDTELPNSPATQLSDLFGNFSPVRGVSSIEITLEVDKDSISINNATFTSLTVDNVNAQPDTDTTPPVVSSINLNDSPAADDETITYTVTFDESASNVSTDDFTLTTVSGNANGTIASVSADSGTSVNVTVNGISGVGSLRLDLKSNTNITDSLGNGNNTNGYVAAFEGQTHTVSITPTNTPPVITSPPITSIKEDAAYNYMLTASDADNDDITWRVKAGTTLPSWLKLEMQTEATVSTFAGSSAGYQDGTGQNSQFYWPWDVVIDKNDTLYVADKFNHRIRKVSSEGVVTTLAGSGTEGNNDGNGILASFDSPSGMALDSQGNLFVADGDNKSIRKVTPQGVVTTVYQHDSSIKAVAVDNDDNIYFIANRKIYKVTSSGNVSVFVGGGEATVLMAVLVKPRLITL